MVPGVYESLLFRYHHNISKNNFIYSYIAIHIIYSIYSIYIYHLYYTSQIHCFCIPNMFKGSFTFCRYIGFTASTDFWSKKPRFSMGTQCQSLVGGHRCLQVRKLRGGNLGFREISKIGGTGVDFFHILKIIKITCWNSEEQVNIDHEFDSQIA